MIARHRVEQVQELPLVFVDALDVHVEQRVGIERRPGLLANEPAERGLVGALDGGETLDRRGIVGMCGKPLQRRAVIENRVAANLAQQPRQPRIGLVQPAPKGDAVGLVDDAPGVKPMQIGENGLAQQICVQRRDAVDAMRPDKREMAHPHVASLGFVDDRERRLVDVCRKPGAAICSRAASRCCALMR